MKQILNYDKASLWVCLLLLFLLGSEALGQYAGPEPPIATGYGAYGRHPVEKDSIPNPLWFGRYTEVFYPADLAEPVPVILFSHAFGATQSSYYAELLTFIVSNGYAVVFSPYPTVQASLPERYRILFDGFEAAITNFPNVLDSTRVGFVGHSFGGGATPTMGYRGFVEKGWGEQGKLLMLMAPWYTLEISQEELESYPADVNLLIQVYDQDRTNDHRMAIDLFNTINIPAASKDFVQVFSDVVNMYTYAADHVVPMQTSPNGIYDAYDHYAVFRLLHALMDYTFTGNETAQEIALGNGAANQVAMGPFVPLVVTNDPEPLYQNSDFLFPCDSPDNPRSAFCPPEPAATSTAHVIPNSAEIQLKQNFPNPFAGATTIELVLDEPAYIALNLYSLQGHLAAHVTEGMLLPGSHSFDLKTDDLPAGIYFYRLQAGNSHTQTRSLVILK